MPLYLNPCSLQYDSSDSNLKFIRAILIGVVLFEILLILVLRFFSDFENNCYSHSSRQAQKNSKIQELPGIQTMQNLNDNNNTAMNQMKKQSENKMQSENSASILKASRKKKQIKNKQAKSTFLNVIFRQKSSHNKVANLSCKGENNLKKCSNQNQFQSNNQNGQNKNDKNSKLKELVDYKMFINVRNFQISIQQAGFATSTLIGNFFIALALCIVHTPTFKALYLSISHSILLVILILIQILFKTKNSSQQSVHNQNSQNLCDLKRSDFSSKKPKINSQLQSPQTKFTQLQTIKRRLCYILIGLILAITLILVALTIVQIKSTYFNLKTLQCM